VESAPAGHPEELRLQEERRRFSREQAILPLLDAASIRARCLTATEQDACLRAVKFFPGYQGGSARA
jgi:hypothetical protein